MKSYETIPVQLTADDILELKELHSRAEVLSHASIVVRDDDRDPHERYTDTARTAMRVLETLNRILKQV